MLSLSPLKLVIVLIVALVLVGPDKLPSLARQMGAAWKAFRGFSTRIEDEVRANLPDLPSTGDIARFARSPVALLDSLAKLDDEHLVPDHGVEGLEDPDDPLQPDPGAPLRETAAIEEDTLLSPPRPDPGSPLRRSSDSNDSEQPAGTMSPPEPPVDPSLN